VNLGDGGGLTRFGIAQKDHPGLSANFYTEPAASALVEAEVIYEQQYWNPIQGDRINNDVLAASVFSCAVNTGVSQAVKILQACLGIPGDGIFGMETLTQTNAYSKSSALAPAFRAAWADFYRELAQRNPADARFLDGWLMRASRIYPS
jgi:lysozyme family protein